jgi:hypothetical protein
MNPLDPLHTLAMALGVATPSPEVIGRVLATRAKPADPVSAALWESVANTSLRPPYPPALWRLAHAISAAGAKTAAELSVEERAAFALSPLKRHRYASNEALPHWMSDIARIAKVADRVPVFAYGPEIEAAEKRRQDALSDAQKAAARMAVEDHLYVATEYLERAKQSAEVAYAESLDRIKVQRERDHESRTSVIDRNRIRVLCLLEHSFASRPLRGLERFALWELIMRGSHASLADDPSRRPVIDLKAAVSLAIAAVDFSQAAAAGAIAAAREFLDAPPNLARAAFRIAPRLSKPGYRGGFDVTLRRRAGFVFGVEPTTITAPTEVLEELRRDDALEEVHTLTRVADLEAGLAQRDARIAELEAQLASANAPAPPPPATRKRTTQTHEEH